MEDSLPHLLSLLDLRTSASACFHYRHGLSQTLEIFLKIIFLKFSVPAADSLIEDSGQKHVLKKGDGTMRIDDKIINYEVTGRMRNLPPGGADRVTRAKSSAGEKVLAQKQPEGDAVIRLSKTSKEAQRIKELVLSRPDIREDKVASMREKIESGDYVVNCEDVADKLVNAFIEDLM